MSADLALLHPDLLPLAKEFEMQWANLKPNNKMAITTTWRSPITEDALHAKGITTATGQTCEHCFMIDGKPASKAFDFALYDIDGNYTTDGTDPLYLQAGELGEGIGLEWGGRWHHPDWDHLQLKQ